MKVRRAITAVAATAAVAGALMVAAPGAGADPGCAPLEVIAVPGTWESGPEKSAIGHGMLESVTGGLGAGTRTHYIDYQATAFPWEGAIYGESKADAVAKADGLIAQLAGECPDSRFALIGYSQGADAAGDLAAAIGHNRGPVGPERLAGVGLLSDPQRSVGDHLVGPPVIGQGASGARPGGFGAVAGDVRTFCTLDDLYCAAPQDDFVGRTAGLAVQQRPDAGSSETERFAPTGLDLIDDLFNAGGIPLLQQQLTEGANNERYDKVENFLASGAHQDYTHYVVDVDGTSATAWLTRWLNSLA